MNETQKRFFAHLASVQEESVRRCLAKHNITDSTTEAVLYEVTSSAIADILTMIDGYSTYSKDRHDLVNMVTGQKLKEDPSIELHDQIEEYLK